MVTAAVAMLDDSVPSLYPLYAQTLYYSLGVRHLSFSNSSLWESHYYPHFLSEEFRWGLFEEFSKDAQLGEWWAHIYCHLWAALRSRLTLWVASSWQRQTRGWRWEKAAKWAFLFSKCPFRTLIRGSSLPSVGSWIVWFLEARLLYPFSKNSLPSKENKTTLWKC